MESLRALHITQLLMTKFCHDITGPIGAINNGVECIEEDAGMREAGMGLIADSAQQAIHRVQLYRYAYGMLKSEGHAELSEKQELVTNFYAATRNNIVWDGASQVVTHHECQLMCNMILITASSLIRGGDVHVTIEDDGTSLSSIRTVSSGSHIAVDNDVMGALMRQTDVMNAKNIQSHYTTLLVDNLPASTLDVSCDEQGMTLHFTSGHKDIHYG